MQAISVLAGMHVCTIGCMKDLTWQGVATSLPTTFFRVKEHATVNCNVPTLARTPVATVPAENVAAAADVLMFLSEKLQLRMEALRQTPSGTLCRPRILHGNSHKAHFWSNSMRTRPRKPEKTLVPTFLGLSSLRRPLGMA
jgi:hypothetical protein